MSQPLRILLIDNYDSFTYNLKHALEDVGCVVDVVRNDALSVAEATGADVDAIVLSPGPCSPSEAGICVPLLASPALRVPVLGVCLGHQSLGQALGGKVVGAKAILHGKVSQVTHTSHPLFAGVPSPFTAARYHSLAVRRADLPPELEVIAETEDCEIMAVAHRTRPWFGLQFHPESVGTPDGPVMLANFVALVRKAQP